MNFNWIVNLSGPVVVVGSSASVLRTFQTGVESSRYPYGFIVSLWRWFGIVLA